MKVTIEIEVGSMDELVRQLGTPMHGAPSPASVKLAVSSAEGEEAPLPAKRAPGRPRKAEKVSEPGMRAPELETGPQPEPMPTPASTPTPAPTPIPTGEKITLEQVRTALKAYTEKHGGQLSVASELLAHFLSVKGAPCQKISELKDEDYPAVLARCAA